MVVIRAHSVHQCTSAVCASSVMGGVAGADSAATGNAVAMSVEQSLAVVTTKHFVSGIAGGTCEAVLGYPFETVKALMQTQKSNSSRSFTGPMDCLQKSIKTGGVASLYRGASPQIFRSAVGTSIVFGLMGQYRHIFSNVLFQDPQTALMAAAAMTGLTEAVLYTPFEIIKIRMQTQQNRTRTRMNNWQCARDVLQKSGVRGLYRGFLPMAKREMVGNTVYFMSYEATKHYLHRRVVDDVPGLTAEQKRMRSFQSIAMAGGTAGSIYWVMAFPLDTIKSVMQADNLDNPRYRGIIDCYQKLFREGGIARFYRGMAPTLAPAFVVNAATFVAFETCMKFLNKQF